MPTTPRPSTIAELRTSGWRSRTVKDELRANLLGTARERLARSCPGIVGFRQFGRPGHRECDPRGAGPRLPRRARPGQDPDGPRAWSACWTSRSRSSSAASSTTTRSPRSARRHARSSSATATRLRSAGSGRDRRYAEKLATPDITIADLIGEVDPIKVAEGRYLSDELTLHYGLIPRANRGIVAINELPDLAERIQVGLLNILEERDVQIRGFVVRLPLDLFVVASANPEDYTSRGRIITPLKDRLGSQIRFFYPRTLARRDDHRPPGEAPVRGRGGRAGRRGPRRSWRSSSPS